MSYSPSDTKFVPIITIFVLYDFLKSFNRENQKSIIPDIEKSRNPEIYKSRNLKIWKSGNQRAVDVDV